MNRYQVEMQDGTDFYSVLVYSATEKEAWGKAMEKNPGLVLKITKVA